MLIALLEILLAVILIGLILGVVAAIVFGIWSLYCEYKEIKEEDELKKATDEIINEINKKR